MKVKNIFSELQQIDPSSLRIPRGGEERATGVYKNVHDWSERRCQQSGSPKCEGSIRIVLVATTHAGNIGAAARAMKTMRLSKLYLVNPKNFPSDEATARASGADDLLVNAKVVTSLAAALSDCTLVIGTSARERALPIPLIDARSAAKKVIAEIQTELEKQAKHPKAQLKSPEVAIVFGTENSGLNNEDLKLCNYHLYIPTNPDFPTLNVAAAVQLVAYEIMMASCQSVNSSVKDVAGDEKENDMYDRLATFEEMQNFYKHLENTLIDLQFLDPQKPKLLMARIRRLFNRARMENLEVNALRGFFTAAQKTAQKNNG